MSRYGYGYLYWGVGWLLIGFLAAELAGYFNVAPWPTLSATVWRSEAVSPVVAVLIFALLVTLTCHFLYHRPLWASVLFGLVVSVGAHLVNRAWP